MLEKFNAMVYYNSTEIAEMIADIWDYDFLVEYLLAMWLKFYPDSDSYDLAFINGLASDYAYDYLTI